MYTVCFLWNLEQHVGFLSKPTIVRLAFTIKMIFFFLAFYTQEKQSSTTEEILNQ